MAIVFDIGEFPVIAAIRGNEGFAAAVKSSAKVIFALKSNIFNIAEYAAEAHKADKLIFFHVDMADGVSGDACGLKFLKESGADGIISTRSNTVRAAKETGLMAVQRFFIIDSQSVRSSIEAVTAFKPDFIEILPGTLSKITASFCGAVDVPVIAGGLIETKQEIIEALKVGASAVSTSKYELWQDN